MLIYFLLEFIFQEHSHAQDSRVNEGPFFSSLLFQPIYEHSVIYMHPCFWDLYLIYLFNPGEITKLVVNDNSSTSKNLFHRFI